MRYRLRTLLLLLAVFATGLGWITSQWRVVAKRQAIMQQCGDYVFVEKGMLWWERNPLERIIEGDQSRRVGGVRRWMGDREIGSVMVFRPASANPSAAEAFLKRIFTSQTTRFEQAHVPLHHPRRAVVDGDCRYPGGMVV
jgi:hypothetical protein